jgi:carbonic anhydrase/acetyltransferase-like protein (isoleucine patch superfamily)
MYQMPGSHIIAYKGIKPKIGHGVFIASGVSLIGDLEIGEETNIWFNTTVRADCNIIRIGKRVNIQDNSVIHVTHGTGPVHMGDDITVGHGAIIHACTIKSHCLIGMGAIILDQAVIPEHSFVAAGSLVSPGKTFPPGHLIKGSPAVAVRPLKDHELKGLGDSVKYYLEYAKNYVQDA